jgi:hypothetical protein
MESGIPIEMQGPMVVASSEGVTELQPGIDRDKLDAEMHAKEHEESEWWKGATVPITLAVELPFLLMIPDGDISLEHDVASVSASVRGNYMEVSDGQIFFDCHANVVHIGPSNELVRRSDAPPRAARAESPIFRAMKTVVLFRTEAMEDALLAFRNLESLTPEDRSGIRRANRATQYLDSLARAHLPFLNNLIAAYRSTSLDPFAFQVSEWDVPIWFADNGEDLVRIPLMPYWDKLMHPGMNRSTHFTVTMDNLVSQLKTDVQPGMMELLDALSLQFRGRYDDAVRSAVTAIEVVLESQLQRLLRKNGYNNSQVQHRLEETRNDFEARLTDYERLSGTRVPGPILSCLPYINGIRLKEELGRVRHLRHKIVHEGLRVDVHSCGAMRRAIETMTWLFKWLSWEEGEAKENSKNFVFYAAMRGMQIYPFEYQQSGVVVKPIHQGDDEMRFANNEYAIQYYSAIEKDNCDLELFASMSFAYLDIEATDGPPTSGRDTVVRERFCITSDSQRAIVFCLRFDGLATVEGINAVALAALAHERRNGPGFGCLCIVHHQQRFPLALRETETAIPVDVCRIAEECGITLVTTTDLYFLIRGLHENAWNGNAIRRLLFLPGRQGDIPPEYHAVGTCRRFFPRLSVISINLDDGETISIGEILAIRTRYRYHESKIESLEVEHEAVNTATGPCRLGVKATLEKHDVRIEQAVFVRRPAADVPSGNGQEASQPDVVDWQI